MPFSHFEDVVIDVRKFGAKGDYTADDTYAFMRAIDACTLYSTALARSNLQGAKFVIYIPAGRYRITKAQLLAPNHRGGGAGPLAGLTFRGDGRGLSQIVYEPTSAESGGYMFYNNDIFLDVVFSDITFTCAQTSPNFGANIENFFYSYSATGGGQNYVFDKCDWNGGGWNDLFHLAGTNNNSEMQWNHCGFNDSVGNVLYIPSGDPTYSGYNSADVGSDQMVNYNFYDCQFQVSHGNYINVQSGGSINVRGGSIMHTDSSNVILSTFFILGGGIHNGGAQRLLVDGVRFEQLGGFYSQLIYSQWSSGVIEFNCCDNSSQQFNAATNVVNAKFDFGGNSGPEVLFIGCALQGQHQYFHNFQVYQRSPRALYKNCEFWHHNDFSTFVTVTNNSGFNSGGHPLIEFEGCRGKPGVTQYKYIFDGTLGWHKNNRGLSKKRVVSISNADGGFPRDPFVEDVYLPLNSIITRISVWMGAGIANGGTNSTTAGWHMLLKSYASTTLAGGIDAAVTSLTFTSVTDFADLALPFPIIIGAEQMSVTALNTSTKVATVTRGTNGTTANIHSNLDALTTIPVTLLDATPTSDNPSLGFNSSTSANIVAICDKHSKRHIFVNASTINDANTTGYIMVEYYG